MRSYTFYGLDRRQHVLAAERISAADLETARSIACERLTQFPMVELWEASVCIVRQSRPDAALH
jgi:hypothetical protein